MSGYHHRLKARILKSDGVDERCGHFFSGMILREFDLFMRAAFQWAPRVGLLASRAMPWSPQRRGGLDTIGASR
jgi:hypothetical protein